MGTRSRNVLQNFIALNRKSIIKILNSKTNKNLVQHVHSTLKSFKNAKKKIGNFFAPRIS